MQRTNISWADFTSNPIRARNVATGKAGHFCVKTSPGCAHCYASEWNEKRYGTGLAYLPVNRDKVELYLNEGEIDAILKHRGLGRVFLCDMTDLFADFVPDEWLYRLFLTMDHSPNLTFQLLTKRPERMREWITGVQGKGWPLPNVWLGVSVENQRMADERIEQLLRTPAAVHFVSCEPLLSSISFTRIDGLQGPYCDWLRGEVREINCGEEGVYARFKHLDWVIAGGESGLNRRPMDIAWLEGIVQQCQRARVPVFVKQASALRPGQQGEIPNDLWQLKQFPVAR